MVKYKQLKEISGKTLFEAGACLDELEIFLNRYGRFNKIAFFNDFIRFAKTQNKWIFWLKEHGFIEEIEEIEEKTWRMGMIIKFNNNTVYLLSNVDSFMVCLIVLNTYGIGNRWVNPIKVNNLEKITKKEMNEICGSLSVDDIEILDEYTIKK